MKTAISIPDEIFDEAEALAKKEGLSRSELYQLALKKYIEERQSGKVTERLDAVYAVEDAAMEKELLQAQIDSLDEEEW